LGIDALRVLLNHRTTVSISIQQLQPVSGNVRAMVESALDAGAGILRLAPNWVPRSFLQPGGRLRLNPRDLYAYGLDRGGIDERWFASTIPASNEGRVHDEGFSYIVAESLGKRCLLKHAIEELGAQLIGESIWSKYRRWPVLGKFFDNLGPIPHHMHQRKVDAVRVGLEPKPEAYYFPPQYNNVVNSFPYTFMGLSPGTRREQVRRCLENWSKGDNGILDLSYAYRLRLGTGWLIPPGVLHAPGSLCTFEPQWASDVFSMWQNLVEGRTVPWSLLVHDMPPEKHHDLDFILDQLDWEANVDPHFKQHHYTEPIVHTSDAAHVDRWIVYGRIESEQLFSAKELTVHPGTKVTIRDHGAYGLVCVQGRGRMNTLPISAPAMIGFGELSEDEFFCTGSAARAGVVFENMSGTEPLVMLRYFGPETNPDAPEIGDHENR
jgi:hypothetical protein